MPLLDPLVAARLPCRLRLQAENKKIYIYGFSKVFDCVYDSLPTRDLGDLPQSEKHIDNVDVNRAHDLGSQPELPVLLSLLR